MDRPTPLPAELGEPAGGAPFGLDELEYMDDQLSAYGGVVALTADDGLPDEAVRKLDRGDLESVVARWRITNLGEAEWAARALMEARSRIDEHDEKAAEWALNIREWINKVTRRDAATVLYMTAQLERYALERRAATADREKSLVLPSATVGTTSKAARPIVVKGKEAAFVAWAEEHDRELRRQPPAEPAVSNFKGRLEIREVPDHYVVDLDLACGHCRTFVVPASLVTEERPVGMVADEYLAENATLECLTCEEDPIDGRPYRTVTGVQHETVTRRAVVHVGTGEEPPGLDIDPGETTAKVRMP